MKKLNELIKDYMAKIGTKGGSVKSEAKAKAARENGKKAKKKKATKENGK